MMSERKSGKVFVLIACILISIVGIYMEFFYNPNSKKNSEVSESAEKESESLNTEYDFSGQELPDTENVSAGETYTDKEDVEVYFSNTDLLDNGNIPLSVQSELCELTQRFLYRNGYEDVEELYVDDDSYLESEDMISFSCFMDGHQEKLQIRYDVQQHTLEYNIINTDTVE